MGPDIKPSHATVPLRILNIFSLGQKMTEFRKKLCHFAISSSTLSYVIFAVFL